MLSGIDGYFANCHLFKVDANQPIRSGTWQGARLRSKRPNALHKRARGLSIYSGRLAKESPRHLTHSHFHRPQKDTSVKTPFDSDIWTRMAIDVELDAIDWKILRELQDEGRMTNVELSRRVGISAPPCLRRVKRLEEAGIIKGYRALLNTQQLGFPVVAFCLIGLQHQSDAELKSFAEKAKTWSIVRRAWMVSGETDFLLHCVARDLTTFQTFVIEQLTSTPNVDTVRTALTIRQIKDEGLVAIGERNGSG